MLNTLKAVTLDIAGKEYPICCDDWEEMKYEYFFSRLTYLQNHEEDTLYKVALYLDYINNGIWDALDEKKNGKIILKKNCHSIKEFIDEALGLHYGNNPDLVVAYFDYDLAWDDMQEGYGEFENWTSYPVMTDWGFIALIPRQ